jgi:putative two-component system response regulator
LNTGNKLVTDEKIHAHSKKVGEISKILAEELGFCEEEADFIKEASSLHDTGKQFIPPQILLKPGKLTDAEFEVVKAHAYIGYSYLMRESLALLDRAATGEEHASDKDKKLIMIAGEDVITQRFGSFDARICEACRIFAESECKHLKTATAVFVASAVAAEHHERPDGNGYMNENERDVSGYAKIVSVADVFDALISKRAYKAPWPPNDTFEYMRRGAGTQFDEKVVDALFRGRDKVIGLYENPA